MLTRRTLLLAASGAALLPGLLRAEDRLFYTEGLAEAAMADGKVVLLDFWASWCTTCASQERTIAALRAENPAYDKAITFITVDWDAHSDGPLATALKIPRRSTLVLMDGEREVGRIVAGTARAEIAALLDAGLAAAAA